MRFLLAAALIAIISFVSGLLLPWWSIAIISFVVALLIPQNNFISFLAGFTGIFVLWFILSLWIDIHNESILSHKVAQLFPLGGSSLLLMIITGLIGAIVAGSAAFSGSSLRNSLLANRVVKNSGQY